MFNSFKPIRILILFLLPVVILAVSPLTSYTQGCKFQAATPGHRASCTNSTPKGTCSPTVNDPSGTGTCILQNTDNSCDFECPGTPPTPVLTTITVTPNSQTLLLGDSLKFGARGYDANGKLIAIAPAPTWSVVANGGTINSSGLFTGAVAGTFANTVKATSGGVSGFATVTVLDPVVPLTGFVDLHTHPLSNIGFGGKLLYGGPDVGALLPSDPDCLPYVLATSERQALGHDKSTHGGVLMSSCGDAIRAEMIHAFQLLNHGADEHEDALGYPDFTEWPVWKDLTHQKMWVEWIRRAHTGGLRVIVALAVNNKTLGDAVIGPGDALPTDDKGSADLQIAEIQSFVGRHADFMEVARSSADLYRIISAKKLAVVIGVEIDNIGNLTSMPMLAPTNAAISAEIDRLFAEGVRYIFPIHVLDNAFGGTAAYQDLFNFSTFREDGHYWNLRCAPPPANSSETITYTFKTPTALGMDLLNIAAQKLNTTFPNPPTYPQCGQVNTASLTPQGKFAINKMMELGMLIDVDHMSQASADDTLNIATVFGYPINSGHNGVRGTLSGPLLHNQDERALRADQYAIIGTLHGMAGVGTGGLDAQQWLTLYNQVITAMKGNGGGSFVGGFGTDTNGFALGMPPRLGTQEEVPGPQHSQYLQCIANFICGDGQSKATCNNVANTSCRRQFPNAFVKVTIPGSSIKYSSAFPRSMEGTKTWDYNRDGVAHYGMLPDFLEDVKSLPGGADVVATFNTGADYFYRTWKITESKSAMVYTLLQAQGQAEVDEVQNGKRRWIPDPETFNCMGLNWNAILQISQTDWNATPAGLAFPSRKDGSVLIGSGPKVYVIQGCQRHWIPDPPTLQQFGGWATVTSVQDADLNAIPEGAPIPSIL